MWMWRWAQITPRSQHCAASRAFERNAGRIGEIAGLANRRLHAELELLGHGDLDLGLLAGRTEHAHIGDAPLGPDQIHLFGAGELARLGQLVLRRQLVAWAEQLVHIGLGQVHVVGRDLDGNRRRGLVANRQRDLVALDGTQGFPSQQALIVVGNDDDGDR
jgi:hypothetical protein